MNKTNTLDYVTWAYHALGPKRVGATALGNEVTTHGVSTGTEYAKDAAIMEQWILDELNLQGDDKKIFEVCDTASGAVTTKDPGFL